MQVGWRPDVRPKARRRRCWFAFFFSKQIYFFCFKKYLIVVFQCFCSFFFGGFDFLVGFLKPKRFFFSGG